MTTAIFYTKKTIRILPLIMCVLLLLPKYTINAIEDFYFGGEPHWTDRVWFYGTYGFAFGTLIFCYHIVNTTY